MNISYYYEVIKALPQSVGISSKQFAFFKDISSISISQVIVWKLFLKDLVQSSLFSLRIRFNNKIKLNVPPKFC